jgi:carbonic anhydrase
MLANLLILLSPLVNGDTTYDYKQGGKDWTGTCLTGSQQSPINVKYSRSILPAPGLGLLNATFTETSLSGDFGTTGLKITGDFGKISFEEFGDFFESEIDSLQIFAPAQHYLNGRKYSLEMTILMKDTPQGYAGYALTMFFRTGASSSFFESLISYLRDKNDKKVSLSTLLPSTIENFYVYDGSLPYPPCTETLRWFIYPAVQTMTSEQLNIFTAKWAGTKSFANGRGNTRYIQSLNNRDIFYHRTF